MKAWNMPAGTVQSCKEKYHNERNSNKEAFLDNPENLRNQESSKDFVYSKPNRADHSDSIVQDGNGGSSEGDEMCFRLIKRNLQLRGNLRSPHDRRSGFQRRCISYSVHIPERRSGTDRRNSDERRKDRVRESQ